MKKRLPLFALLITLFLTACGTGSNSLTKLDIEMDNFSFSPSRFTVPAGNEITVNVTNQGSIIHDFIIMKSGIRVGTEFGDDDIPNIYWKVEMQPGTSQTFGFTSPEQVGAYQILCGIPGHIQAGMVGTMTVVK